MDLHETLRVVVGTYQGVVYGLQPHHGAVNAETDEVSEPEADTADAKTDSSMSFRTVFAAQAHEGCVKSVAASGAWLVSGGTDELIR